MIFVRIIHLIIRISISENIQHLTNTIKNERNFNRFHFRLYFRTKSKSYTIEQCFYNKKHSLDTYIELVQVKNTRKNNRRFNRKLFRPRYFQS